LERSHAAETAALAERDAAAVVVARMERELVEARESCSRMFKQVRMWPYPS
jgi:hypothetical protein